VTKTNGQLGLSQSSDQKLILAVFTVFSMILYIITIIIVIIIIIIVYCVYDLIINKNIKGELSPS